MEENKPVPIKYEPLGDEKPILVIERRKKRKRNRRGFKRFAVLAIALCLIYFSITEYDKIKGFISSCLSSINSDNSIADNSGENNEQEKNNEFVSENDDKSETVPSQDTYAFIDTSPDVFQIINESDVYFELKENDYSFPNKNELYSAYSSSAPIVLIVHFSPYEAYTTTDGYSSESSFYNEVLNVKEIGQEICNKLNESGINAIHLTEYENSGTLYEGKEAYISRINEILLENPSISYIFDISRGICVSDNLSMKKETIEIDGAKYPTIQLWCGTSNTEITSEQSKGIHLANALAKHINNISPLLVSKQTIAPYDLNQAFSCPTVRVDIGSYACNYNEALSTASLFSEYLIDFLS